MKSFFLGLLAIAAGTAMSSCQKDFAPGVIEDTQPVQIISSKDPVTLSASLKVWHAERINGAAPVSNSRIPSVSAGIYPIARAIAGRYAIIKPKVTSGNVAGYYLALQNAGQYFKVDYAKPRHTNGRNMHADQPGNMFTNSGTADSSIVIELPDNINAPDTFCVTYCPYDSIGNVGDPVTTCVYVETLGADNSSAFLLNDFKLTSYWWDSAGIRTHYDTLMYNQWYKKVAAPLGYYCDNSTLTYGTVPNGITNLGADSTYKRKYNLRFATNGAFDFEANESNKKVDVAGSICSQLAFNLSDYMERKTGGYSYNSQTNKLIVVYEFNNEGTPDVAYHEFALTKITDTHITLKEWNNLVFRFER